MDEETRKMLANLGKTAGSYSVTVTNSLDDELGWVQHIAFAGVPDDPEVRALIAEELHLIADGLTNGK
jgi:hypothetical protein